MVESARRQRRTVLRVVLVAELVVALVTAATVVYGYNRIDRKIVSGEPIHHKAEAPPPTSALNILVMGQDSRNCAGCDIDKQAGEGGSDTTILIHVTKGRKSAYGISIPRDTLVDRPDCTTGSNTVPGEKEAIWNEAFALGGPECTVEQLEAVTGIYVDKYIVVDFGGFKDMVDALHGVEVCIPAPIDDVKHNIHLDAGTQVLDGTDSLQYVRQRTSTPNADLGRMKRQQAFIASMIGKVMTAGTLTRPDKVLNFATALAGSIQTSPDLASVGKLVRLATSLKGADLGHIKFVTAPTTDFPPGDPNWGRLELTPAAHQLWQKVIDDRRLGTIGRGAISANKPSGSKQEAAANGLCS